MTDVANFDSDLQRGIAGEQLLIRYLQEHASIRPANRDEQRQGIDVWILNVRGELSVEFKTDEQATKYGNAFIEIAHIGQDLWLEPGWLQKCDAHRLAYYCPAHNTDAPSPRNVLWLNPQRLRGAARTWLQKPRDYRIAGRVNQDYTTYGLLVPLAEVRLLAGVFPE